jgi:hypothetical protein
MKPRRAAVLLPLLAPTFVTAAAAQGRQPLPLRVLYLGNEGSPRAQSYLAFLREHFSEARAAARDAGADPGHADVVLLDWAQSDVDLQAMASIRSPLGPRQAWATPTVLLGSAGLLLAGPWELIGSYG